MNTKNRPTEKEIDAIVISQVDDDSAWEKSVHVKPAKSASLSIPAELAARASFLAKLHRKKNMEEWLTRVIEERIELEEAAFIGVKQDLSSKVG